ncbi:siderophore-interacting protein [Sphingomonas sp. QA11]|uniref:siderophore-interacting protein n=1 Tax=Sphingomonas sp. QA11 TaxID=2950605 RepID=UPI00234A3D84|nr:siderophore-interacting protein [Sphingomonas sp. QA11]WCM28404.1 siderophore-interacting protein [Sphingomonas sp. QA11]
MTDSPFASDTASRRFRATRPNRIEKALTQWLTRTATVTAVEPLSPRFRLIDLEGEAFRHVAWTAGDKIQVILGGLLTARTFTPMSWDARQGRTRLLVWSHGEGPGTEWATGLAPGDACQFFGPRRSLDAGDPATPLVVFGDETSFGLAAALAGRSGAEPPRLFFEVSEPDECRHVLRRIGGEEAMLAQRTKDDAHLEAMALQLAALDTGASLYVVTGRAPAIRRIVTILKAGGVPSSRLRTKAYWAPGKVGLD